MREKKFPSSDSPDWTPEQVAIAALPIATQTTTVPKDTAANLLQDFDFIKFVYVLKRSLIYIFLILVLSIGVAYLYLRYTKPVYESKAEIKIDIKSSSSFLGIESDIFKQSNSPSTSTFSNLASEIEIITSYNLLREVIDSINLHVSYHSAGEILSMERFMTSPFKVSFYEVSSAFMDKEIYVEIINHNEFYLSYMKDNIEIRNLYRFREPIETPEYKFIIEPTSIISPTEFNQRFFFIIHSENYLLSDLRSKLKVEIANPAASIISISFTDYNILKAATIIDNIIKIYQRRSIENKNRSYEKSLDYLYQQIQLTRDSLDYYEKLLSRYRIDPEKEELLEDVNAVYRRIRELNDRKEEYKFKYLGYDTLKKMIESNRSPVQLAAAASLLENNELNSLVGEYAKGVEELNRIIGYYKEHTFAFRQKQQDLESQKAKLIEFVAYSKQRFQERIKDLENEIQQTKKSLERKSIDENNLFDLEYKKIKRAYDVYENTFNIMLTKVVEINLAKAGTVANFQVLGSPNRGGSALYPIPLTVYLFAIFIGVLVSVGFVVIRYFMQNTVNNLRELDRLTKLPILGVIPEYNKLKMTYSQLVVHLNPKSSISEAYRTIRTNLDYINVKASNKKIISVTSTVSGEGKTFVSLNTAGVIAMSGMRVLLVDLDLRKPKIHTAFGVENTMGISSILVGRATVEECLYNTNIPSLKFITSGPIPPNPSELLMTDSFPKVISEMSEMFDVVVLDTPPVGLVTDGLIAIRQSTNTIYVVRADYSKLSFITGLNRLVQRQNLSNIGIVLNAVSKEAKSGYGEYGYGGYTGYGGDAYGYYE
ncbi:MAG: polysaccharide biosynthesis tyrosine autokinase [Cytophagales bacterium]|nr:polysaccharide biosynthesis tyrosine autokinase [Cytophagales bacterium]MDW8385176.1 polysaccharide biosynthesis tyrosine autokinase [Flammeovirgaceae bacterium]